MLIVFFSCILCNNNRLKLNMQKKSSDGITHSQYKPGGRAIFLNVIWKPLTAEAILYDNRKQMTPTERNVSALGPLFDTK